MSELKPITKIELWLTIFWPPHGLTKGDESWRFMQMRDRLSGCIAILDENTELWSDMLMLNEVAYERMEATLHDHPNKVKPK